LNNGSGVVSSPAMSYGEYPVSVPTKARGSIVPQLRSKQACNI
jgi:hypothetical protein